MVASLEVLRVGWTADLKEQLMVDLKDGEMVVTKVASTA